MALTLTVDHAVPRDLIVNTLRLVWIEVRRGAGPFALPFLLVVAWWGANRLSPMGTISGLLWPSSSLNVAYASVLLLPVAGGLLAWEGSREHRRRMGDLLVTMPGHAIRRDVARWAGSTGWAILAYALLGVYELVPVARAATWGGPRWDALGLGIAVIAAGGAIGYAAGVIVPSRFTPPVVAVLLFGLVVGLGAFQEDDVLYDLKYLSPYSAFPYWSEDIGLYQEIEPNLFMPMAAWMLAIGAVVLAGVALRRAATVRTRSAMVAAVVMAGIAMTPLVPARQHETWSGAGQPIPYEPLCQTETIEVCVHPALESLLDDYARSIGSLVEPIAGIPGGPIRAVPSAGGQSGLLPDGTFAFFMPIADSQLALELVSDPFGHSDGSTNERVQSCPGIPTNAQYVAMTVLVRRVSPELTRFQRGDDIVTCEIVNDGGMSEWPRSETPEILAIRNEITAATDRFSALTLDQQRAWFAVNLVALRAGELSLEDLP